LRVLFLSAVIVLIDQVSKFFIKGIAVPFLDINIKGLNPGVNYPVIGETLKLSLIENPGLGFGLNPGYEYKFELTAITILLSAGLLAFLYFSRKDNLPKRIATAFLLGGAIGNLIDRVFYGVIYEYAPLFYGNVVDFLNIRVTRLFLFGDIMGNYVFNVADIAVTIGLIIYIFSFRSAHQGEIEPLAAENQE